MKSHLSYIKLFLLVFFITGLTVITYGQNTIVSGTMSVKYLLSDSRFHVYFTPTSSGSGTIGNGSTVGLTAPTGSSIVISGLTSYTAGTWIQGGIKTQGGGTPSSGSSSLDYWDFYVSADYTVNFTTGTPVELFSFINSGSCAGGSFNINTSTSTVINNSEYGTVILNLAGDTNQAGSLTTTNVDSPNSALCAPTSPDLVCSGISLSPNTFTIGTPTSANLTINLSNVVGGGYTFTETTAANFATNPSTYTANLTTGQSSVIIPVNYDGGGTAGTQTLTINMSGTSTSCTVTAVLNAASVVSVGNGTVSKNGTTTSGTQTGNAALDMNPSGASSYVYSVVTCNPTPSNTTALPASSNLMMTNSSTGAYSYTVPSTPGSYSYCIKVCDASNASNCATSSYTLNVTAVCNAGSVAPSVH